MWHCFDFGRPVSYAAVLVHVKPFSQGEYREMTTSAALRNKWWNAGRKLLARALSHAAASSLSASTAMVRPGLLLALLLALAPVCLILTQSGLHASGNTITVNNTTDPASTSGNGFCTLREAINNANAASDTSGGDCAPGTGTDTIKFSVSGMISLTSTLPAIATNTLTIDGTGQSITVDGASSFRVFVVSSGAVNLNSLTISDGSVVGDFGGAAILSQSAQPLSISNSTFSNNYAHDCPPSGCGGGNGGALDIGGPLTIANSTFVSNSADEFGGAIDCVGAGPVSVSHSVFSGNKSGASGMIFGNDHGGAIEAGGNSVSVTDSSFTNNATGDLAHAANAGVGGAIYSDTGTLSVNNSAFSGGFAAAGGAISSNNRSLTVSNSTFANNTAIDQGGAIDSVDFTTTISNSTFLQNDAMQYYGGGISFGTGNPTALNISNSTFSGNSAGGIGGAVFDDGGTATLSNTILAGSSGGDCAVPFGGSLVNGGYNIADDVTCGFGTSTGANGKTIGDNTNPLLDPNGLQNNGGPTKTIGLQSTSPAVDAVPLAGCPATDQRGYQRPDGQENTCDIGAYESGSEGAETLVVNPSPPSKLNFGTVSVGTTSASQTATITSEFNDDTVDFFATFILANYVETGSTCGSTLGPLQSCQVSFACKPKTTGALIGAYAFLYGSLETSVIMDGDDYRKIGVVQFTCTGS
jgi:CSLREA domain-containing protein